MISEAQVMRYMSGPLEAEDHKVPSSDRHSAENFCNKSKDRSPSHSAGSPAHTSFDHLTSGAEIAGHKAVGGEDWSRMELEIYGAHH